MNVRPSETVRFMCPVLSCRAILSVPSKARGEMVVCQQCGTIIRVPSARDAPAAPAEVDPKS